MDDTRPFPIQSDGFVRGRGETARSTIPWWLAEVAYEFYVSRYGTSQSLSCLAERGGFGRDELVGLIRHLAYLQEIETGGMS